MKRNPNRMRSILASVILAFVAPNVLAHAVNVQSVALQACKARKLSEQCSFKSSVGDVYRGTCQKTSGTLICVRNQPIERSKPHKPH